jgi:DNA-binding SARP family transcriptional activator/TolB-like protein/Tfp pilus assembly protein PilF
LDDNLTCAEMNFWGYPNVDIGMNSSVRLLGPFQACDSEGGRVVLPTRKAEALLAILAMASRGGVPRDQILNLLWNERAEGQARHSLSQTLTSLRQSFGKDTIAVDRDAVRLKAERLNVDLHEFLRAVESDDPADLQRAATLYRGSLLDGLALREAPFEQWVELERRRLAALAVDTLVRLGEILVSRGDDAGTVRAFERALVVDPLSGAAHAALMRFHLDREQTAQVARHYAHCVKLYRRELDAEPESEIRDLARKAVEQQRGSSGIGARRLDTKHAADVAGSRPGSIHVATEGGRAPARTNRRRYPSLVILPFRSSGPDRHFTDGMADEISLALFRLKEFRVIDRQSVLAHKGGLVDVSRTGLDPTSTYVTEGRVRRSGSRFRALIQLINAETRALLWCHRYEGAVANHFAIHERIANEVAGTIQRVARSAEIERAGRKPENRDAYDLVLRAYPHLWSQDRLRNREAIRLLQRSVRLDPDYARAHALLAWCLTQEIVYFWSSDPGEDRDRAHQAIEAAIPCIDDDPTAMAAIGAALSQCGDQSRAAEWLDRALELDPNNAWTWGRHGYVALYSNDAAIAKQRFRRSLEISPYDPFAFNMRMGTAMALGLEGSYHEAIETTRDVLVRYPSVTWANRLLASYCALTGEMSPARIALKKLIVATPNMSVRAMKDTHPMRHIPRYYDRLVEGLERSGLR